MRMNSTANWLVTQFGLLGVVLIGIGVFGRWFLKRLDEQDADRKEEREKERVERESMVAGFIQNCEAFNVTMSNHLAHQEEAFRQQQQSFREQQEAFRLMAHELESIARVMERVFEKL